MPFLMAGWLTRIMEHIERQEFTRRFMAAYPPQTPSQKVMIPLQTIPLFGSGTELGSV